MSRYLAAEIVIFQIMISCLEDRNKILDRVRQGVLVSLQSQRMHEGLACGENVPGMT